MDYLTKFHAFMLNGCFYVDAFMLNRNQAMDLKTRFKIRINVCKFLTTSAKSYKLLKTFRSFVTTVKSGHSLTIWK